MRPQAPTLLAALLVACGSSGDDAPADTDAASSSTGVLTDDGAGPSSGVADSTGPGPGTDTEPTASTGGTMDTGDTDGGCTGPEQCDDPDLPFCEMGACVPCSSTPDPDASCLALDPATPVCTDAKCSPCSDDPSVCTGPTPICADSGECVPCNAHDQCPAMAGCDLLVGECLPADAVYYVDDAAACPGDGSEATPFCTISAGVSAIGANNAGTLRIAPTGNYDVNLSIGGNQTLAMLGTGGPLQPTVLQDATAGNTLAVANPATTVYADHLRFQENGTDPAISVNAATFYGTRLEVVQNNGGGITVDGNAEVHIIDSFVGSDANNFTAVDVTASDVQLLYSTIYAGTFSAVALACNPTSNVTVRNSILVTRGGTPGDEIACSGLDMSFSATEGSFPGTGNDNVGMFPGATPEDWFVNVGTGDYHLQNAGTTLFNNIATWQDGDPLTDIDGDARPGTNGAADYPGADVP